LASLNNQEIIGNLGNDPEMRTTYGGKPMTVFNVATNYVQTSQDGERKQATEWFTVVAYNKLAEQCNQFLAKGKSVYAQGRLHLKQWQDDSGNFHARNEIVASRVIFLDKPVREHDTENDNDY